MIFGMGTDIVEVERIKSAIEKYGDRFLNRIFTEREIEYCNSFNENKFEHFAARFAAKESFSKAIGTGITRGFKFREVGIRNEPNGKPLVELEGGLKEIWGDYTLQVSLSHTTGNAVAFLIMEYPASGE
ncbi:MAG: holo-ACP synthase [Candidatus Kapaibacterium sp.]